MMVSATASSTSQLRNKSSVKITTVLASPVGFRQKQHTVQRVTALMDAVVWKQQHGGGLIVFPAGYLWARDRSAAEDKVQTIAALTSVVAPDVSVSLGIDTCPHDYVADLADNAENRLPFYSALWLPKTKPALRRQRVSEKPYSTFAGTSWTEEGLTLRDPRNGHVTEIVRCGDLYSEALVDRLKCDAEAGTLHSIVLAAHSTDHPQVFNRLRNLSYKGSLVTACFHAQKFPVPVAYQKGLRVPPNDGTNVVTGASVPLLALHTWERTNYTPVKVV